MMGIVHHSAFVIYLEEGRSELARQHQSGFSLLDEMGYALAVSDLQLQIRTPARYDDQLTVCTWVEELRSRSLTFVSEVVSQNSTVVHATGRVKVICVDENGQACRFPAAWIAPFRMAFSAA
jgi:acyl-CoA thioester hydrolase